MGLGKTYTGSEKMKQLGAKVNLLICQKSKIDDWVKHYKDNYPNVYVYDLTIKNELELFLVDNWGDSSIKLGVINYELAWRRPELLQLEDFTLMLDESSMIQNEKSKRSKFILSMKPANTILLSGTPTGGKYEKLWSQCRLLGWDIGKTTFYSQYILTKLLDMGGFKFPVVVGYKNVERLKQKLREHGAHFLKTEEVFDLPEQIHQTINVPTSKDYRTFRKDKVLILPDAELVGDTTLTRMLYERQLCGQYSKEKLNAFRDLLQSSDDQIIVFYNFTAELTALKEIAKEFTDHVSVVNGECKDLSSYEKHDDSITFIQYQAGAMGLNLQKSNKIIYFTPPLSSELFEQSKKRTHRIGQVNTCFYYYLCCKDSIEEKIYKCLSERKDFTDKLFE